MDLERFYSELDVPQKNEEGASSLKENRFTPFEIDDAVSSSSCKSYHQRKSSLFWSALSPNSWTAKIWYILNFVFTVYNVIRVPYQMAFCFFGPTCAVHYSTIAVDAIVDAFFILDVFFNLRVGIFHQGQLIMNTKQIRQRYLATWFWIDVAASIPLDIPLIFAGIRNPWISLNKLLRIPRMIDNINILEESPRTWTFFIQNLRVQFFGFLLSHYAACGWILIGQYYGYGSDAWVPGSNFYAKTSTEQYIFSLFWSLALLSRMTLQSPPERLVEDLYTIILLAFGVFGFAYLVGRFSRDIFYRYRYELQYHRFRTEIAYFLRHHGSPKHLQKRVYQYLLYRQTHPFEPASGPEFEFLDTLSEALRSDLRLVMYHALIEGNPMFDELEPALIAAIFSACSEHLVLPGQFVYRRGEPSEHLYFLKHGHILVTKGEDRNFKKSILVHSGSAFGLKAFLAAGSDRTTSAQVHGSRFALVLSFQIEELNKVLSAYPLSASKFLKNVEALDLEDYLETAQSTPAVVEHIRQQPHGLSREEAAFWTLHPLSRRIRVWDVAVAFSIIYNVVGIPFRVSFASESFWTFSALISFGIIDFLLDSILWVDVYVHFHRSFFSDGELVEDMRQISENYMRSFFGLVFHVFTNLPTDYIAWIVFAVYRGMSIPIYYRIISWLRLNRIFRILDLPKYINSSLRFTLRSSTAILLAFFSIFLFFVHFSACFYFLFSRFEGYGGDDSNWLPPSSLEHSFTGRRYTYSVYFVFNNIFELGANVAPETIPQAVYSIFLLWFGAVFGSFLIGAIGSFLVTPDENLFFFNRRLESVQKILKGQNVPKKLQERVRQHLLYHWEASEGIDPNSVLSKLPLVLRREIIMHIASEFIHSTPFLRLHPELLIREILPLIRIQFIPQSQPIFFSGDLARNMYHIIEGQVQITRSSGVEFGKNAESQVRLSSNHESNRWEMLVLGPGEFFGEIDLLSDMFQQRQVSARTVTPCQLLVLSNSDVTRVLRNYAPSELGDHISES